MGTAWTYDKDIYAEHVAIRTKAGLMDVSGLKKVHYVGPHAESRAMLGRKGEQIGNRPHDRR